MELLTLPSIDVRATGRGIRSGPSFDVCGPGGEPLGSLRMTGLSLDGRIRRFLASAAEYPFTLTLTDPGGTTVLMIDKERENRFGRYLRVAVRLADGRGIGAVEQKYPLSERITFHGALDGAPDAEIASAPASRPTGDLVVVREPGGGPEWARREFVLDAGGLGSRTYRLHFAPDAPVLVRALLLGWTAGADAQLLPAGGEF